MNNKSQRHTILAIAGFGDNASMYDGLAGTALAQDHKLIPLDLPGFGAPPLAEETSLAALAGFVAQKARETSADTIIAHSVASIIASLAARTPDCPLENIISLEGNLTAEDAYFSGLAADYDSPEEVQVAIAAKLDGLAQTRPVIARYRDEVAKADPDALWQLGCDAKAFSKHNHPGDALMASADVTYVYNPDNCPTATLDWLDKSDMKRILLKGASHWPSVTEPEMLAEAIERALG
ncbi:alpha/beta fold hydrolase [Alterisphingorhabdus coralli]|uniref:Alpha/beta fold hydrolase n=1 Tax=Alterisphingorhabdus coralli TaxID=3071408 RepID=A0AA97F9Z6_9SPHN|nr:alpha/beta fold hydrolase [Parasphingorhabdus sp. SCSIO 66989]WOE75997.1 alpha/beta fold hydrolase [Parasphingorhabdus sp. SCSIO 66989]